MRNVSHKAAATVAIGLLTDDLLGALLEAPTIARDERGHPAYADYAALPI
jgi:hypothetical protein